MVLALDLKEFHLLNYFKSLNWQMLIKFGLKHKLLEFSIFFFRFDWRESFNEELHR